MQLFCCVCKRDARHQSKNCKEQSDADAEVLAVMTCLDGGPDGVYLPVVMEDREDGESCLSRGQQDQQHKGGQHSLIDAVAAQAESDIRQGHKACHHINQACWLPTEINLCIPASRLASYVCSGDIHKPLRKWLHMTMQRMCAAVNMCKIGRNCKRPEGALCQNKWQLRQVGVG